MEFLQTFLDGRMWSLVASSTWQTIIMVFLSTIFSMILGLPVGVLLHVTSSEEQGGIIPLPAFYSVLSRIVNILRSFPFIILMILLLPKTFSVISIWTERLSWQIKPMESIPFVSISRITMRISAFHQRATKPIPGIATGFSTKNVIW